MTWTVIRDRLGECIVLTCEFAAQLVVGDKIVIYNPRIKGGFGNTQMIVDDTTGATLFVLDKPYTNVCWYCGIPDTDVRLKKCGNVPRIIVAECQVEDWKTMQHKDICLAEAE